jgi:hypothetical protein
MADPMDAEDELEELDCRNWASLRCDRPVTFVELQDRRNNFMQTGEFVCLREPIRLTIKCLDDSNLSFDATIGRIVSVITPNAHQQSKVVLNLLAAKTEFRKFPYAAATPPAARTYLLSPPELVWLNIVKVVASSCLKSEAFVFRQEFLTHADGGFAYGMENAYFVRYRLQCDGARWSPIPTFFESGFHAFPHSDCYSKRGWDNLLALSRLICTELSRSSIGQSTRQTKIVDYSSSEWAYLSYRLYTPAFGDSYEKDAVSTSVFPRKHGTKEIIKVRLTKFTHRIDTEAKFLHLQGILGQPGITIGLRLPNPRAPKMKTRDLFVFTAQRATIGDTFNLFQPLAEISIDGTTHRPKHCGIDFVFDDTKMKMKVSLRFRKAMPGDAYVRHLFGFASFVNPIVVDGLLSDSSEDEEQEEEEPEEAPQPAVVLQWLDLLGTDEYLLRVRRVLNLRTHVVVSVQESTHTDFVVGSERVLTMDEAVDLYREYHDID